jgi:N-acetylmuramoyl-L-alanine amidase
VWIVEAPSPNYGPRTEAPVDILLLHYTGMQTAAAALARLCDPLAEVSCHWLIDEDGTVMHLVDETQRAWHAGRGFWAGTTDVNSRSVGIELVNPGHDYGYRPFPPAQMQALVELSRTILDRHPIPPHRVLGHSDIAPARKVDPGELFDWRWLAGRGIGLWADPTPADADPADGTNLATLLARYGYGMEDPAAAIAAFQRHFRPAAVTGTDDPETRALAAALVRRAGVA